MFLVRCGLFLRRWTRVDPTIAAVVTDVIHRGVVDHCRVVNVVNVGDVHVVHRTVVIKLSVLPTSTFITLTEVSIAVTDPAIKTYLRTPVAVIEDISVVAPAPIAWGPEETDLRSHDPCTRHPVVIAFVVVVGPIARCPEITLAGYGRLLVHGQRWRGECNRYADLRVGCRRHGQHYECEQQRTNGGDDMHFASSCRLSFAFPVSLCCCGLRGLNGTIFGRNVLEDFVSLANSSQKFSHSGMSQSVQESSDRACGLSVPDGEKEDESVNSARDLMKVEESWRSAGSVRQCDGYCSSVKKAGL
jgi:hypothetical protein